MKKIRIACGALTLAAMLGCGCQVWAANVPAQAEPLNMPPAAAVYTELHITAEVQIEQVVNRENEHYLLALDQSGAELRLDFVAEGDEAALLVDAQTGILADWDAVQPGGVIMLNYSERPQGNILHYLLLNLPEERPKGLFTVEELAGITGDRILVNNGRLWVTLPKGVWQRPKEYEVVSLGVGHQVLLWYDGVDESIPAKTTATRMLHLYSPQEIEQMRQAKIRMDMYYNDLQTRHVLANGVSMPDSVIYVHGEPYLLLRQTAEALGYDVDWDAAAQTVHLSRGDWQVSVVPFKGVFWPAGGKEQAYYGLPRTYPEGVRVPARMFELFGADIAVDGQTMIINLQ